MPLLSSKQLPNLEVSAAAAAAALLLRVGKRAGHSRVPRVLDYAASSASRSRHSGLPLKPPHLHSHYSAAPALQECWWVSAIGSISSLIYCMIALILVRPVAGVGV